MYIHLRLKTVWTRGIILIHWHRCVTNTNRIQYKAGRLIREAIWLRETDNMCSRVSLNRPKYGDTI